MQLSHFLLALGAVGLKVFSQCHPKTPTYPSLPSLREQSSILDNWTAERVSHVPELMRKYGVGAWLVRNRMSQVLATLS